MSDGVQIAAEEIRRALDEESCAMGRSQRWYASKARHVAGIEIVESITLRDDPLLLLALVQTRFATGTHELYQLPLALRSAGEARRIRRRSIARTTTGPCTTRSPTRARRSSCCAGSTAGDEIDDRGRRSSASTGRAADAAAVAGRAGPR